MKKFKVKVRVKKFAFDKQFAEARYNGLKGIVADICPYTGQYNVYIKKIDAYVWFRPGKLKLRKGN